MILSATNPYPAEFDELRVVVRCVVSGQYLSVIVHGAKGIGKSFTVEDEFNQHPKHRVMKISSPTLPALVHALYEMRTGGTILLDDSDKTFLNATTEGLDILKHAMDNRQAVRTISRPTMSRLRDKTPNTFQTRCQIFVISNVNITDPALYKPSLQIAAEAVASRVNRIVPFSNDPSSMLEYICWLVRDKGIMKWRNFGGLITKCLSRRQEDEVLDFFVRNAARLPMSVREFENIATLAIAEPQNWQQIAARRYFAAIPRAVRLPIIDPVFRDAPIVEKKKVEQAVKRETTREAGRKRAGERSSVQMKEDPQPQPPKLQLLPIEKPFSIDDFKVRFDGVAQLIERGGTEGERDSARLALDRLKTKAHEAIGTLLVRDQLRLRTVLARVISIHPEDKPDPDPPAPPKGGKSRKTPITAAERRARIDAKIAGDENLFKKASGFYDTIKEAERRKELKKAKRYMKAYCSASIDQ